MSLRPLIVVVGTTGVGKSNLAIELALHLARTRNSRPRVINADAMQVYAGMDIITNKVPENEQKGVEHLLMGFRQPGEQYVVGHWVRDAMRLIDDMHRTADVPIVVGGTSYWIQHLLFPDRLAKESPTEMKELFSAQLSAELKKSIDQLPPELLDLFMNLSPEPPIAAVDPSAAFQLHTLLASLDAPMAARWHWKDTRKVHRSLCIIKETGCPASHTVLAQSKTTSKPRYRTLCFWLYAKNESLHPRLNARVDKMLELGLLDEVRTLRKIARNEESGNSPDVDYTLGIYQSIGYREFNDYLSSETPSESAFTEAIDRMKISTRQYAKRQISWIRNKLLPAMYAANDEEITSHPYLLDATDLTSWSTNVQDLAIKLTEHFLDETSMPDPSSTSDLAAEILNIPAKAVDPLSILKARRRIICPVCTTDEAQPVMVEEETEWIAHQRTRAHRRRVQKKANEENYGKRTEVGS